MKRKIDFIDEGSAWNLWLIWLSINWWLLDKQDIIGMKSEYDERFYANLQDAPLLDLRIS